MVGVDFSAAMLDRARRKSRSIDWVEGDLLALPFPAGAFDAATVGFGVRNAADLDRALAELRRVLVSGGRLAVLEIAVPQGRLAPFYRLWLERLVPVLGRLARGGGAYTYLPASVRRFPDALALAELMRKAGFADVRWRTFAGGMVTLHTGVAR